MFADKIQLIGSLSKGFAATTLELLVVMSGLLTAPDYRRIGPVLWSKCLNSVDARVLSAVRWDVWYIYLSFSSWIHVCATVELFFNDGVRGKYRVGVCKDDQGGFHVVFIL